MRIICLNMGIVCIFLLGCFSKGEDNNKSINAVFHELVQDNYWNDSIDYYFAHINDMVIGEKERLLVSKSLLELSNYYYYLFEFSKDVTGRHYELLSQCNEIIQSENIYLYGSIINIINGDYSDGKICYDEFLKESKSNSETIKTLLTWAQNKLNLSMQENKSRNRIFTYFMELQKIAISSIDDSTLSAISNYINDSQYQSAWELIKILSHKQLLMEELIKNSEGREYKKSYYHYLGYAIASYLLADLAESYSNDNKLILHPIDHLQINILQEDIVMIDSLITLFHKSTNSDSDKLRLNAMRARYIETLDKSNSNYFKSLPKLTEFDLDAYSFWLEQRSYVISDSNFVKYSVDDIIASLDKAINNSTITLKSAERIYKHCGIALFNSDVFDQSRSWLQRGIMKVPSADPRIINPADILVFAHCYFMDNLNIEKTGQFMKRLSEHISSSLELVDLIHDVQLAQQVCEE